MRMNDMNKLFEQRGFEVKRIYRDGHYIFSIAKDNYCLSAIYVYPACTTYYVASRHQKEFVESTIKKFEEDFKEKIMNTNQEFLSGSWRKYCADDIFVTEEMYKLSKLNIPNERRLNNPGIEKVIFNPPATIVIWKDGIKTVVKCGKDDVFDPEKGMAMAICKRFFGNKGNYCNEFKKWLPNFEVATEEVKEEAEEENMHYITHSSSKRCGTCRYFTLNDFCPDTHCDSCVYRYDAKTNEYEPTHWAPKEKMEEQN